jgi:hypothetical protein
MLLFRLDEDDEKRTLEVAKRLTRDMWQYFDEAQPKKAKGKMQISEVGLDKDRKTKKIDDSCIFLNRKGHSAPGFTGDFGCVLHHLAQKEDIHFVETKPDVCWQLPIRRSFEQREFGEQEITVNVIGEYERLAWGDGGEEFFDAGLGDGEAVFVQAVDGGGFDRLFHMPITGKRDGHSFGLVVHVD